MAHVGVQDIYDLDPQTGRDTDRIIARQKPASAEAVNVILASSDTDPDGRSEWLWVRLANGDLLLATYPQGDGYFAHEVEASF